MITCYSKTESGIGISLIWILQASDLNVCYHGVPRRATSDPARPRTSNTCHHPAVRFIVSAVLENSRRWGPTFSSFLYNPQGLKRYQHILVSQSIITEWFSDWKFNMSPHFSSFLENWLWHFILMLSVYCWESAHSDKATHTWNPSFHKPLSPVSTPPPFSQSDVVSSLVYQICLETDHADKEKPTNLVLIQFHADLQFLLGLRVCMGL